MTKFNRVLIIPTIALILGAAILVYIRSNKPGVNPLEDQDQATDIQLGDPFEFENKKLNTTVALGKVYIASSEDKVYKIDPNDKFFPSQSLAKSVAKILDLSQADENTWKKADSSVSFIKSTDENFIKISLAESETTNIDEDLLADRAEEELKSFDLWPFSSKEFETKISILEEPNLNSTKATLTFSEEINSNGVITNTKGSAEISVEFNEDGQITEIVYFYVPYKIENSETHEFKSSEEIEKSLTDGKYLRMESTGSFSNIKILDIRNAYYASTSNNYIQPVIVVTGRNEFDEEVELLVPAYKEDVY